MIFRLPSSLSFGEGHESKRPAGSCGIVTATAFGDGARRNFIAYDGLLQKVTITAIRVSAAILIAATLTLAGCGGSSAAAPTQGTLVSIAVTPLSPTVPLGLTQQLTATGTYSNGTTQNITDSVTWSSATQSVATVSNSSGSQGEAAGVTMGTSAITATEGGISSPAVTLTVGPPPIATWTQQEPLARFSQSMVYDSSTQQIIVFGGQEPDGATNLNDVWLATTTTDPDTLSWTALLPTGNKPSARYGHVATYDSSNHIMTVFGGAEGAPGPCANDVWTLDGANGQGASTWLSQPTSGTSPAARTLHTGVYDPGSNTLTVFGGSDCNSGFFNDVWVLSNANGEGGTPAWTQLLPTGTPPAARESSTAIYDSVNHIMTVYGGDAGITAPLGDVWTLSNANGSGTPAWTLLSPTAVAGSPGARTGHTAVYDSANNVMNIFAGSDGTATLTDNWILSFANGLGGTPAWSQLAVTGTAPELQYHTAVYDQTLNNMYVFAGTSSGDKLLSSNHTFTLPGANGLAGSTQWYLGGPPVRYSASAFLDPNSGSLFIYAGQHAGGTTTYINFTDYQRDSGILTDPLTNSNWTKIVPSGTGPDARYGHTGLYDPASNAMMVFGGALGGPGQCANDSWVLQHANAAGATPGWNQLSPSGNIPSPRMRHSSVYDSATNSLIIFGGFDCTSTYFNDVWILSNANDSGGVPSWTELSPTGTPPGAREAAAAIYDSATNSLILFGGDDTTTEFGDVWELSHANGTGGTPAWTQLTPTGTGPSQRTGASAVYDSAHSRMIIDGGEGGGTVFSDVWIIIDANGAAGAPAWTQLIATVAGPARYYHNAVYDEGSNQMFIFAGASEYPSASPVADVFTLTDANGLQ